MEILQKQILFYNCIIDNNSFICTFIQQENLFIYWDTLYNSFIYKQILDITTLDIDDKIQEQLPDIISNINKNFQDIIIYKL